MKPFIFKLCLFCITFFIVEKVFYIFLQISPSLEVDKRLEKLIDGEINKDLIILGSSRGARNIIASQLDSALGISSYNLSYLGSDITFHEFILETYIKFNNPPKIVVLVIDEPDAFQQN